MYMRYAADGGGGKQSARRDATVKQVYLIFKTHLDLGFTNLASDVELKYFHDFIPRAIETARILKQSNPHRRFVWTIDAYIIYEYLNRYSGEKKSFLEDAIRTGDIAWHAMPFTTHTELLDRQLFEFGLSLSRELDERYGKNTAVGKLTDVPGHTKAMIPSLVKHGVKVLHIGVNSSSAVPKLPEFFTWKNGEHEVAVMYHKDGYGINAVIPGTDSAIVYAHTGDNFGPQNAEQVIAVYDELEKQYPNAVITGCAMNDICEDIISIKPSLPVITSEIGDTWIYGIGTDPCKVAGYQELSRLRTRWIGSGVLTAGSKDYYEFSKNLLCVAEHTWGYARFLLDDYKHYSHAGLRKLRAEDKCKAVETSWKEQRGYVSKAAESLVDPMLRLEAETALNALLPVKPSRRGYTPLTGKITAGNFTVSIDEKTGCINYLRHGDRVIADMRHPLARFSYNVYSKADCEQFAADYIKNLERTRDWSVPSFTKPGLPPNVERMNVYAEGATAGYKILATGLEILTKLDMPTAATRLGCPKHVFLRYMFPYGDNSIEIELSWFDKSACRIPEALFLSFIPNVKNPTGWLMDKMGSKLSIKDVLSGGSKNMHALQGGMYHDELSISSVDAPLIVIGSPDIMTFTRKTPDVRGGFHFNLFNNKWNTNFPYWYEDDAKFRFTIKL